MPLNDFATFRKRIAAGETTCSKTLEVLLSEIDRKQRLNAFLDVFSEPARKCSVEVDSKLRRGTAGPLAGMFVAVKDSIAMKDRTLTCGSRMLQSYISPYDATVVRRLVDADAIIIGKTNMDEFAMGSSNENSAYGPVRNPVDEQVVPGGSSGGSAVAVAAGLSMTALGTDTGGSVRQPAAMCGVVGLKPTYGRVSRYGLVAFASSFDQVGVFGSTVYDTASVLSVIAGHDPSDSTSVSTPVPNYLNSLDGNVRGIRIGLPKEYFTASLSSEIAGAISKKVDVLRSNGALVKEISLPHTEYTIAAYYVLTTAEASSNLARFDGARYGERAPGVRDLEELYVESRSRGFGREVKRRIMLGTYVLSAGYYDAYYLQGQKIRRLIRNDFVNAFQEVDCILTPTSPGTAFRLGEKLSDPLQMYLSDVYTVSANLAGIPGISIPCGKDGRGLPIGLQLLGNSFDEQTIFRVGHVVEQS
ncbi:MAG TPA: Asp-tRNA(Asn)/Glu-tRNA(Gln) amidotransferase subunit GatA [Bacteroidota bacterium]|nr:Asp-tRNA(Asn)/Glu-tRNA(Gln) amidotransferase subunit GatA [Bacteroidota bacterium]